MISSDDFRADCRAIVSGRVECDEVAGLFGLSERRAIISYPFERSCDGIVADFNVLLEVCCGLSIEVGVCRYVSLYLQIYQFPDTGWMYPATNAAASRTTTSSRSIAL